MFELSTLFLCNKEQFPLSQKLHVNDEKSKFMLFKLHMRWLACFIRFILNRFEVSSPADFGNGNGVITI